MSITSRPADLPSPSLLSSVAPSLRRSVAFLAILTSVAAAEPKRIADVPEFADLLPRWQQAMEGFDIPGYSIAIIKNGELIALDAFGVRNPQGEPATPDTMYYIASITKTYTGAGVVQLRDEGKLSLDTPVAKYLPRFKVSDSNFARSVTVRDLLCHRHGINQGNIVFLDAYTGEINEDRYYHFLEKAEVAGHTDYTNVHFTLLGRVIESVSGKPWQDYLNSNVFDPIGMKRTTAYASEMYGDPNCAIPMEKLGDAFYATPERKGDKVMHAAGGMGTSARDAAIWLQTFFNDGVAPNGKRLLKEASALEMLHMQSELPEPDGQIRRMEGFGLAWNLGTFRGHPYAMHGGGYIATAAIYAILPEHKHGVVVLCNSDGGGALMTIVSIDVLDRLLGEEGHDDLLPNYLNHWSSRREARQESRKAMRTPADITLPCPAESLVGSFANEYMGTIHISQSAGRVSASIGDLPVSVLEVTDDTLKLRVTGDEIPMNTTWSKDHVLESLTWDDEGTLFTFIRQ